MSLSRHLARAIENYDSPASLGSTFRARRIKPLLSMIRDVFEAEGQVNILDIGGTRLYWRIISDEVFERNNVSVTLVNMAGHDTPRDEKHFKYIEGDACDLSRYGDNSFHIVHSNSIIEHVGDWSRRCKLPGEIRRLAPRYFVQTPYFWFPLEPHFMIPFFHWLPKPVRVSLVMRFTLGQCDRKDSVTAAVLAVEGAQLLDKKMFRELFKDASIQTERVLLFPKSLIAIKQAK